MAIEGSHQIKVEIDALNGATDIVEKNYVKEETSSVILEAHWAPVYIKCEPNHKSTVIPLDYCDDIFLHSYKSKEHLKADCKNSYEDDGNSRLQRSAQSAKLVSNKKNYVCEVCDKSFDNVRAIKQHLQIHYSSRKLFSCAECNKSYTCSYNLVIHKRSHTGERPFLCDIF